MILTTFVALNLNASEIATRERSAPYQDFVGQHSSSPVDYVLGKFKDHKIVSVGEVHENADALEFLTSILSDQRFINDIGTLVWEFGNANNQSAVEAFLAADKLDDSALVAAYHDHTHPWGWPFQSYLNVYRAVWKINHSGRGHIDIINADVPVDWDKIRTSKDYKAALAHRDEYMAGIIEKQILAKGRKAIFYAGEGHANKLDANKNRRTAINLLLEKYPGQIFTTTIHRLFGYDEKVGYYRRTCDGLFDYAFTKNGKSPLAFDLFNSPFGSADSKCLESVPAGYRLQDMFDGYLYLGPPEKYRRSTFIKNFYNGKYLRAVAERTRIAFGRSITETCEIKTVSEFPSFYENFGDDRNKFQSISAWKE